MMGERGKVGWITQKDSPWVSKFSPCITIVHDSCKIKSWNSLLLFHKVSVYAIVETTNIPHRRGH